MKTLHLTDEQVETLQLMHQVFTGPRRTAIDQYFLDNMDAGEFFIEDAPEHIRRWAAQAGYADSILNQLRE